MNFTLASSPHNHVRRSTATLMKLVLLAMVPGVLAQLYFFGWGVLFQLLLAVVIAVAAESACLIARNRHPFSGLNDYSAVVTATLLAVSIPPLAPWWIIAIGVVFAVAVVKHLFGGIGQNIFNPAMAGYVLLLISFPVQMTSWLAPGTLGAVHPGFWDTLYTILFQYSPQGYSVEQLRQVETGILMDAVVMATPLDHIKTELSQGATLTEAMNHSLFSGFAGAGWLWVNAGYLTGGLFLLQQRIIQWHIPAALLGALSMCTAIGYLLAPDHLPGLTIHLFSGATMLAAFFIATDPVSAATSAKGKLIYAALIGVLVYLIRSYGGYPDAVAFAVLLANLCVPVIDQYTRPVAYGHKRGGA